MMYGGGFGRSGGGMYGSANNIQSLHPDVAVKMQKLIFDEREKRKKSVGSGM